MISTDTSLVYRTLKDDGINFQFIDQATLADTDEISSEDVLILPNLGRREFVLHRCNPKIIIWQIYPSVCTINKIQLFMLNVQMKKICKSGAFVSMDKLNYETISRELGWRIPKQIISLPIDHLDYKYNADNEKSIHRILNISYLGRALDWKAFPVIKLLQEIKNIPHKCFKLHIFTDIKDDFKTLLNPYLTDNVWVIYYEGYHGEHLLNEIVKMDIHFAMGISALEGAALGVPTLSAPYSHKKIQEDYKFHWLFEDIEGYAGESVEFGFNRLLGHSFPEIVKQVSNKETLKELSKRTYMSITAFSLDAVANQIKNVKTTLHLKDCHYRMVSYWRYRIIGK